MTKLKIKVTKYILEHSKNCKDMVGENCAIALAVRDVFPNAWVEEDDILPHFQKQDFSLYIPLPSKARVFIKTFDKKKPEERAAMDELEFEIEIPDSIVQKINIDEIKPLLQNHPTLELITNAYTLFWVLKTLCK